MSESNKKTTAGACGKGYEARKGFAITGDYINNQPIFCSTMQQARELFCTIATDKHCLKANVYLREYEKDEFVELVKAGKYRQAMELWGELVCEDELRIIKGTMIVPSSSYVSSSPSYSNTSYGPHAPPSASRSTSSPKSVTGTVANGDSKKPLVVHSGKTLEQMRDDLRAGKPVEEVRAELLTTLGGHDITEPQLALPESTTSANDKGEVA